MSTHRAEPRGWAPDRSWVAVALVGIAYVAASAAYLTLELIG